MKNPYEQLGKEVNRQITNSGPPEAAKVVARQSNGNYHVQTFDGLDMYNVSCQASTRFVQNDWVALEMVAGDWTIVGRSERRGGD